jgi:YesN/AraC family two-component response regulator
MYKILLVDDEPMVIHGLCQQIDWESYNLVLAGTAETGESILYRIGISNLSYYNRIFNKAYGLSPLAFKYQNKSK